MTRRDENRVSGPFVHRHTDPRRVGRWGSKAEAPIHGLPPAHGEIRLAAKVAVRPLLPGLPILLVVVPLALPPVAGCRESKPSAEVVSLEGKIEKLKVNTDGGGEITLRYYSEKQRQELLGVGMVTSETEIMINGAIARLKDLREGDRVRGDVRVEIKGEQRRNVAVRIYVERPQPTAAGGR